MGQSETIISKANRDVLLMLSVELREAKTGRWCLRLNAAGVDVDFVEMLQETITEIERLRLIEQKNARSVRKN